MKVEMNTGAREGKEGYVYGPIEGILLTYLACKGGAAHWSSSAALRGPHAKPHSPPTRLRFTLTR